MNKLNNRLFRKAALDRVSSPEQLDVLIRVVPSQAWLTLLAIIGVLIMALAWGWFGSIPTIIKGPCIFLNKSGLASINSSTEGRIEQLFVTVGDVVSKDQVIARVGQTELEQQLDQMVAELDELKQQQINLSAFSKTSGSLSKQANQQQRATLKRELVSARESVQLSESRAATQRELLGQGLVTRQSVIDSEQAIVQAQLRVESIRTQLKNLSLERLEKDKRDSDEKSRLALQISSAQRTIDHMQKKIQRNATIRSAYSGRVVEISIAEGALVSAGSGVVKLEQNNTVAEQLKVVAYIDTRKAKKAKLGMKARVIPSTVKREESGFLIAHVGSVSQHAVGEERMMQRLQNRKLVAQLSNNSVPNEIGIDLVRAGEGYQWSSIAHDAREITSGTICEAEIVIQRQRPLSLVVPTLRKTLGVD